MGLMLVGEDFLVEILEEEVFVDKTSWEELEEHQSKKKEVVEVEVVALR